MLGFAYFLFVRLDILSNNMLILFAFYLVCTVISRRGACGLINPRKYKVAVPLLLLLGLLRSGVFVPQKVTRSIS